MDCGRALCAQASRGLLQGQYRARSADAGSDSRMERGPSIDGGVRPPPTEFIRDWPRAWGSQARARPDSAWSAPPPEVQGMSSIYVALYLGGKIRPFRPGGTNYSARPGASE